MPKEKISKIIDIINWGEAYFNEKGIPESRLNIELLLCSILKCKRMNLYLNFDKPLVQDELDLLREYVKRRISREPVQYITGETEFMGLLFKVNHNVLIPRPETELLVEEVIKLSKQKNHDKINILDIGSGSGNISISLAKLIESSSVTAVDYDSNALEVAKKNAELNSVFDKITFLQLNILNEELPDNPKFDIIVSNPPYISSEEYVSLDPEIMFEPKNALTDLNDGLTFYRKITALGHSILNPDGVIAVEIAYNQGAKVSSLFAEAGYSQINMIRDYSNIDRIITGTII